MRQTILKLTIAIILSCFVTTGYTQMISVSGFVSDSTSKQALSNATLTVKGINKANFNTTIKTTDEGLFFFIVPQEGLYRIETTYSGYQNNLQDSVLIDAQHASINNIYLLPAANSLNTVTVAAKKPYIIMSANKITINVAQSAMAAGGNAYDVVKNVPGIIEQNDALSFRGKSINVLINGRPSNLSGEDLKTMLTNMQASGIEKVEVLPNPSAKYDASGGSIVNIILAKNKLYGTNYTLTTGIGTGKNLSGNAGLDINYRNKNINVFGGYNYAYNQQYYKTHSIRYLGFGTITADEYDIRERNNHSYKLGIDYDMNKHTNFGGFITGAVNYRDRGVENTSILHHTANVTDSSSAVFTNGKAVIKNPLVNVYYKTTLDTAGKELTINMDYMNYSKTWYDYFTNRYYNEKGEEYIVPDYLKDNSPAAINVYSLTADYVLPTKKGSWEAGIKTNYTVTDNDIVWQTNTGAAWMVDANKTNHFVYKENVNAGYLNYIRSIKMWNVQAGVRVEQTNTTGHSITTQEINKISYVSLFPFIDASFTGKTNHTLSFSYRKTITRFGFDYVNPFITYQNQYAYSQGNPHLQPQINHNLSVSYLLKQNMLAGIEYSHAIKSLGTSFASQANITVTSYANFKGTDVGYAYINYSKTWFSIWRMNVYAYSGYFNLNVSTKTYTQKQSADPFYGLQLNNNLAFKKGFSAECLMSYRSAVGSGIFQMQPYYYVDAGIGKAMFKSKLVLKLSASDIFNTQKTYMHANYQGVNMDKNTKVESRFLRLTVKYNFGNNNVKNKRERQSKLSDIKSRIN